MFFASKDPIYRICNLQPDNHQLNVVRVTTKLKIRKLLKEDSEIQYPIVKWLVVRPCRILYYLTSFMQYKMGWLRGRLMANEPIILSDEIAPNRR